MGEDVFADFFEDNAVSAPAYDTEQYARNSDLDAMAHTFSYALHYKEREFAGELASLTDTVEGLQQRASNDRISLRCQALAILVLNIIILVHLWKL